MAVDTQKSSKGASGTFKGQPRRLVAGSEKTSPSVGGLTPSSGTLTPQVKPLNLTPVLSKSKVSSKVPTTAKGKPLVPRCAGPTTATQAKPKKAVSATQVAPASARVVKKAVKSKKVAAPIHTTHSVRQTKAPITPKPEEKEKPEKRKWKLEQPEKKAVAAEVPATPSHKVGFTQNSNIPVDPGLFDKYFIFLHHDDLLTEGMLPPDLSQHVVLVTGEDEHYLSQLMKETTATRGLHNLHDWYWEMELDGREGYRRPPCLQRIYKKALLDKVMIIDSRVSAAKCVPENVVLIDTTCDFSVDHVWDCVVKLCRALIDSNETVPAFIRSYSEVTVEEREYAMNFTQMSSCTIEVGVVRPTPPLPLFSRQGSWWTHTSKGDTGDSLIDLRKLDSEHVGPAKKAFKKPFLFNYDAI